MMSEFLLTTRGIGVVGPFESRGDWVRRIASDNPAEICGQAVVFEREQAPSEEENVTSE
jgi:hypothetical protein